ncbi:MAG: TIGR03560 family F420-dependent LLM class oxidoreductase [Chloroflexi bacterium]|nr:TIGR03560 family F420-dependent LLM class oxidoreductase [Chloroflexota bacterium]
MDIAIMIEGQNGLNWPRWQRLALAVEALGFAGLYRSDHYTNASAPDRDSLELWVSLAWLADHTRRIQFGPRVTPVSFRHPTLTARMASAVDDLSGGRLTLGLGAGWQEREHAHYGWDLLEVSRRFVRFEEGIRIIRHLLSDDRPLDFDGEFYRLREAVLLPRPARHGGPPLLIGGNGAARTLPLAARYAAEWNAIFLTPNQFSQMSMRLDELLAAADRRPGEVRRSMMTGCYFGRDAADAARKAGDRNKTPAELRAAGMVIGTAPEMVEQLGQLATAGVQRVMLQWLDLDDVDGLEALAHGVLPQFS